MATIIAARFEDVGAAERAWQALQAAGFGRGQLANFHVNALGQQDIDPKSDGGLADPNSTGADEGALKGAAIGATAAGIVGGVAAAALVPGLVVLIALGSAAAGAYAGSLAGALNALPEESPTDGGTRRAGLLVAVRVDRADMLDRAAALLREHGGVDVEQAEGTLRAGKWVDFDPRNAPEPVPGRK